MTAGVLFLARADGVLEIWDLLEATHQPVAEAPVSAVALTSLAVNDSSSASSSTKNWLAVGEARHVEIGQKARLGGLFHAWSPRMQTFFDCASYWIMQRHLVRDQCREDVRL